MKVLNYFEEKIKSSIDVEELKHEAEDCFKYNLENTEHNDVREDLLSVLGKDSFLCQFSGITLHLLNSDSRKPFLRIRLDILNERSKNCIAWYELEYGLDGEIQDDYFDLV